MALAKVNGLFRLSKNAELRYSQDGKAICKLSLVSSEKYNGNEQSCFIDCTAFGKVGEIINQYAGSKGTQIYVSGKLVQDTWEKDGQKRSKHAIILEGFDFVSGQQNNQQSQPQQNYQKPKIPQNTVPEIDIEDESIPF